MLRHARTSSMLLVSAAAFSAAALGALPALADRPPVAVAAAEPEPETPPPDSSDDETGGGVLFYGLGSFANIHGLGLSTSGDTVEPDPLKNKHLRLDGGGHVFGGGLQVDVFGKYVRGGFAISVFGVEGTKLRYDSLGHGFSASATNAWGAGFDVFVGHELLKGPVRPYIDLVASIDVVSAQVDLKHPEFGRLGRTEYQGWMFGFGPRAGLSIPIGSNGFLDLSGNYSVVGMERFRIVAGIGIWGR